jgi:hypothetical protein
MVLRHAVTPGHRLSAGLRARSRLPTLRQRAEWQKKSGPNARGNCLYEHHHGHDERAEAGA